MINLVWFLTGFIVGIFALMFILICYEEHYVIKVEKQEKEKDKKPRKDKRLYNYIKEK